MEPKKKLIESARVEGRYLHVTTYDDGPHTPIKASLLFRSPDDARRCHDVLTGTQAARIDGIAEALRFVSMLITEDPAEFLRGLPPDTRAGLIDAARKAGA